MTDLVAEAPAIQLISCAELAALLDAAAPCLLLDIREHQEYALSHIPSAQQLSPAAVAAFAQAQAKLLKPEGLIVVYCSVGVRSARAAQVFTAAGFTQVKNLSGAIFQWANEGRALAGGTHVHPFDAFWAQQLIESRRAELPIEPTEIKPAP
jgi:rhodanese-related sulfurtransferase